MKESVIEYADILKNNGYSNSNSASKDTIAAHSIKFMNEPLDVMDFDENSKNSYLVMDDCTIHKSARMIRKIESQVYRAMHLPPNSPEVNPIEQFWALVKGISKHHRLLMEEDLSSRIGDACNDIPVEDLASFANHSKCQIINCYNKTSF
jgi:transposase